MKQIIFILLFNLAIQPAFAQKTTANEFAAVDKKALQLPDSLTKTTYQISSYITSNFVSDKDKSRAIFTWVASNIEYDIANMFAINFYEKKEDKISKPLKTRKGICENYAALFTDICLKSGIKSFVVEGYTKQNGFTDYIPHAWSAALIDTAWFLFDPTWGSGYVNGGKFFKKINNDYYKTSPSTLIKTHIPFDYLWQFLPYPVTNQEFYESKTQQNKAKPYFNFRDSIHVYEKQSDIERLMSSAYRVEKNGVKNAMVFDRLQHLKIDIENDRQSKIFNLYNAAVNDYNDGISRLNEFIDFRNKQFLPKKTDAEIQAMIDIPNGKLKESKIKLAQLSNPDANMINMIGQLTKSIGDVAVQLKEHEDWLKIYFSKNKSGRKSMFYERKLTFFGIPVK